MPGTLSGSEEARFEVSAHGVPFRLAMRPVRVARVQWYRAIHDGTREIHRRCWIIRHSCPMVALPTTTTHPGTLRVIGPRELVRSRTSAVPVTLRGEGRPTRGGNSRILAGQRPP